MPVYVPVPVSTGPVDSEKVNQKTGFVENAYWKYSLQNSLPKVSQQMPFLTQ